MLGIHSKEECMTNGFLLTKLKLHGGRDGQDGQEIRRNGKSSLNARNKMSTTIMTECLQIQSMGSSEQNGLQH